MTSHPNNSELASLLPDARLAGAVTSAQESAVQATAPANFSFTSSESGVEGHAGRPWPSPKLVATFGEAMGPIVRSRSAAGFEPGLSDSISNPPDATRSPVDGRRSGVPENTTERRFILDVVAFNKALMEWV
jgi:hypothetical protein